MLKSSRTPRRTPLAASIATLFTLALGAAAPVSAATLYWDGGDANGNWSQVNNWGTTGAANNTNPVAIPGLGDEVVFYSTGAARLTPSAINQAFAINSITFGNGQTGAVTISSSSQTLTLNGTAAYEASNYNSGATGSLDTVGLFVQSGFGAITLGTSTGSIVVGAAQSWINNSSNTVNINSAINYSNLLTFGGTGSSTLITTGTGTGGAKINGGTVLNGATTAIFSTGALELAGGGKLASTSGVLRTYANNLAISGDFTFGDLVNTGGSTFTSTTQTVSAPVTLTSLSDTTFGAGYTWGAHAITYKGPGLVTQTSTVSAATNTGNIAIGDTVSSGSLGGNVTASPLTAMGSGSYTINYGGILSGPLPASSLPRPANVFTVNNGGTLRAAFGTGGAVFQSGSTYGNNSGVVSTGTAGTGAGQVSFPTAGVLLLASANTTNITGAYPSLSGTLAFNGTAAFPLNMSGITTLSSVAGSARTLALNVSGNSTAAITLGGLQLNADLTLAGTSVQYLIGFVPGATPVTLGQITQDTPNSRSIIFAMAPTGIVIVGDGGAWLNTNINSGTLRAGDYLGTGLATLNGGVLRLGTNLGKNITVSAAGSVIESTSSFFNYSGNLTLGSNNLGVRSVNGGGLTISGATSGAGGFTVATAGVPGTVFFTGAGTNNPLGSGIVTVGKGLAFGGTAVLSAPGQFSTNVDSIYNVGSANTTPNLSSSGTNKDVWIGVSSTPITSYTLPSTGANTANYRVVPISNTTLATTNLFNGSNNLIISAGAVPTDVNSSATNVLGDTFALGNNNSQNYTGTTLITGVVRNALMGGGTGAPTFTTAAGLTATTGITVNNRASFTLTGVAGGTTGATNVPITVKGGGTMNVNIASALTSSGTLTLGGDTGGGTYVSGASSTQTLASLTVAAGSSTVNANASGVLTISGGAITRTAPGGTLSVTNASTLNLTGASAANVLGGWAHVGSNFAAISSGTVIASTPSTNNINTASGDFQNTNSGNYTLTAPQTVNSINLNTGTNSISVSTFGLTVSTGGIISSSTLSINGTGTLSSSYGPTASVREMIFNVVGSTTLTVFPQIVQNNSTNITLTKTGAGTVVLANTSNQIGDVYAHGGIIKLTQGAGSLGSGTNLYLYGGTVETSGFSGGLFAQNITVGAAGGTLLNSGTAGGSVAFGGTVGLNGLLTIGAGASGTALNLGGVISGAGPVSRSGGTSGKYTTVLGSSNPDWTGGMIIGQNVHLRLDNAGAAGSGRIVGALSGNFPVGAGTLYLNAENFALTQDIANLNALVNWTTTGTSTLSGKLYSTTGFNYQGNAASGATSETVLAGSVSIGGAATTYNWGTATAQQNFVNAQGGLTSGVTNLQGATTLTSTSGGLIDLPTNTTANNGALGFLRFSGANSFIPGAVGPGYLAALHKGGDATSYGGTDPTANGKFGYSLTGGSTYALPEGKSFVIGSLGSGTQFGGTLGATGTGTNTAILTGSAKLVGFAAGDINIHANALTDTQTLNLSALNASDTLQLGTNGIGVVFSPTYGDSGTTSSITLLATRTGATTINKIGAGTVDVVNAHFDNIGGATESAKAGFTVNVNAGTLKYSQTDTGTAFGGVNVNHTGTLIVGGTLHGSVAVASGGTIKGTGTVAAPVAVAAGGTIAPGNSIGTLSTGNFSLNGASAHLDLEIGRTSAGGGVLSNDRVNVTGSVTLASGADLQLSIASGQFSPIQNDILYLVINDMADSVSGVFTKLNNVDTNLSEGSQFTFSGQDYTLTYLANFEGSVFTGGNDVALMAVPEPGSWGMMVSGLGLLLGLRRFRRPAREI